MRVAVLMSTYNGENYMKEQIESILNQRGNFELDLWVRDDGSTDATKKILMQYEIEKKLHWYEGRNLKPALSFMDLIKHCENYDYYAFADQDDYWMPDKLWTGIMQIKDIKTPSLYCSNAELVDDNLKSLGRDVYKCDPKTDIYTLACAGGLLGCTMIFNCALAQMIQNYSIPERLVMHDFYIALVCVAVKGSIRYDEDSYMLYRQHENNVVGVSYGFLNKITSRCRDIVTREKNGIDSQAEQILKIYGSRIGKEEKRWLEKISGYRRNLFTRLELAASFKTRYMNKNMAVKLRMAILLGNR